MDTIYALATARGKAGVAVIRISGPGAFGAGRALAGNLPAPRRAGLRRLKRPGGEILDEALVIAFPSGSSFTGEDTVELHLHGSRAVVAAVLGALSGIEGLRPAESGEFTRRALENDRLDLAQVEGLAELIDAETEAQRRQAQKLLSGDLGKLAASWRRRIVRAAALLEATIDFSDEEVPEDVAPEVESLLEETRKELAGEIEGIGISERIRDGFEVAIVGAPNAGKSTLLNALAGREAAITSEVAGTTRDVIEVRMDLRGIPVTFLDTAGLRETADALEAMGIERAISRARAADLRLFLDDGEPAAYCGLEPREQDIRVVSKIDLRPGAGFGVSGKTGQGVSELISKIADILEVRAASAATATRDRHRRALRQAVACLDEALSAIRGGTAQTELVAEDLRHAARALEGLVGLVDVEHLLDEIFSSFCIGK